MFTWGVVGPHRHTMDVGGAMISCVGLPALQLTPSASRASLEFWPTPFVCMWIAQGPTSVTTLHYISNRGAGVSTKLGCAPSQGYTRL
jgi:hypothetical protein